MSKTPFSALMQPGVVGYLENPHAYLHPKEEYQPMIFTPLPKGYRPKTPPPAQASFNLKNPPPNEGEVSDSHHKTDRAMRLHFLGDENAIQGDSPLPEEFTHTSQDNSIQKRLTPVFFSGNSTRQETLTATEDYYDAQEQERRTPDVDTKLLEEAYDAATKQHDHTHIPEEYYGEASPEQHNPTPNLLGQVAEEIGHFFPSKL